MTTPVDIYLNIIETTNEDNIKGNTTAPTKESLWKPSYLDYNMTVYRVDRIKGSSITIRIKPEKTLNVIFS